MAFLLLWLLLSYDWTALVPLVTHQVPRLEMRQGTSENTGVCSAVVFQIDTEGVAHALTAAHCVDHAPAEHFDITANGRTAKPVLYNRIFDLAIIQFRPPRDTLVMQLAAQSPVAGSEVGVAGYAFGIQEIAFQFGHVAQPFNRETKALWLDARVIFGDSGGAVFNVDGQLVGVTTSIFFQGPANMGGAVPIETVRDFIDDYRDFLKHEGKKQ